MKLFRLAFTLGSVGLLAASLGGCLKAPDYSTTPEIGFDNITNQRLPAASGGIPRDSVRLTIRYQDGDGDLGLSSAERTALLGSVNFNNYFIEPYVKQVNGRSYLLLASLGRGYATGAYNSGYPHVTPLTDNKAAPIKGTLTFALGFNLGSPFLPGEKVKFSIQIADRALHRSNTVMTDSIVIGPR